MLGRDLLATNLDKVIGDGKKTKVWGDPWKIRLNPTVP